mmetsp:Transcript_1931/g.4929  ORF Transcript_1931/g.4929 Transcript_1931/m.4929 type:complete len:217 (-) Transcript_1931:1718-2368(-)
MQPAAAAKTSTPGKQAPTSSSTLGRELTSMTQGRAATKRCQTSSLDLGGLVLRLPPWASARKSSQQMLQLLELASTTAPSASATNSFNLGMPRRLISAEIWRRYAQQSSPRSTWMRVCVAASPPVATWGCCRHQTHQRERCWAVCCSVQVQPQSRNVGILWPVVFENWPRKILRVQPKYAWRRCSKFSKYILGSLREACRPLTAWMHLLQWIVLRE